MLTTFLDWWVAGWVALEEWKLRLTSAKVEVEVEAELGNIMDNNNNIVDNTCREGSHRIPGMPG